MKEAVELLERPRLCSAASHSQSLDAGDDGVKGGLHVGGGAGGHNGLGLFVEQLCNVLHRETRERQNKQSVRSRTESHNTYSRLLLTGRTKH